MSDWLRIKVAHGLVDYGPEVGITLDEPAYRGCIVFPKRHFCELLRVVGFFGK